MFGHTGRILRIDLSTLTSSVEQPTEAFYRTYGGGRGFIAYTLLNEVPLGTDPLSADNVLVFATGPATGFAISGCARHSVGAKSPLTGGFGDGEAGGFWGHELKCAGWDAVIVSGRAPHPVFVAIVDDDVSFHPAQSLLGQPTFETAKAVRAILATPRARVATIGPAGERLSRMAAIVHDSDRLAGRCGLGAVMGSKNLKALAVRGTQRVQAADPDAIRDLARFVTQNLDWMAGWLAGLGTGQHLDAMNEIGNLPVRNFQGGNFAGAQGISAEAFRDNKWLSGMRGCYACAARCKKAVEIPGADWANPAYGAPEYETVAAFGSNCGVSDLRAICEAHEICNANGLDTISAGDVIAWAIECFEAGILTPADTGGLELRWGDAESMLRLLKMMIAREGIGAVLADGARAAVAYAGPESAHYSMEVKGQGIAMHEPRLKAALGLGYMVSPTGADHSHNVHDTLYAPGAWGGDVLASFGIMEPLPPRELTAEKVRLFTYLAIERHLRNVLDICMFIGWPLDKLVALVRAATGWNVTSFELIKMGERAINLTRVFNLREGLTAADDRLPERFLQPHPDGALSDHGLDPDELRDALHLYYGMMGWDQESGTPREAKLDELNLSWAKHHLPGA